MNFFEEYSRVIFLVLLLVGVTIILIKMSHLVKFIKNFISKILIVVNTYKKIDYPRRRFKQFFWWAVLVIILTSILETISKDENSLYFVVLNVSSKIIIAVTTSFVAAALIEIFSGMREVWVEEQTQKEFREFFGCGLEEGSVALVIPRFPMEELIKKYPEVLNLDLAPGRAVKRLKEVNDMVLAYSDIKASSDFLVAFSEKGLFHHAEMFWDDEILSEWKKGEKTNIKTFIIIGLYSNSFFWEINDAHTIRKFFKLEKHDEKKFSFKIAKRIGDILDWHTARKKSSESDFILISKVKLNNSQKALIVGGISAKGTEYAGKYLRENWKTIYAWFDSSVDPQVSVKDHEFAMSISVPFSHGLPSPEDVFVNDQ